jgi:hypothetical protein
VKRKRASSNHRAKLSKQIFGQLFVLHSLGHNPKKNGMQLWLCLCICGKQTRVYTNDLKSGHTKSCGCQQSRSRHKHNLWGTPVYRAFYDARTRCRPDYPQRKDYFDRGIRFRFNDVLQWFAALGHRPSDAHTVDRINNDGHYQPGNVRWATRSQQQMNRRKAA